MTKDTPKDLPNLSGDYSISDNDSKRFNENLKKVNSMNTPKKRVDEIVNLIISNTASQYSEEWKPDIVYTKEQLIELVESFAKQEVERACKEQKLKEYGRGYKDGLLDA